MEDTQRSEGEDTGADGGSRRAFLTRAAVGGAVAWTVPTVLTTSAAAAATPPPPPVCVGVTTEAELRAALADTAQATITVCASITLSAAGGPLQVDRAGSPVTVVAGVPGATIAGIGTFRILFVASGSTATFQGVTFTNGATPLGAGGAIFNAGTLTLTNCRVQSSSAIDGGGISNSGTLTTTGTTVTSCSATQSGGAVRNVGTWSDTDGTFTNNVADLTSGSGGGLDNTGTAALTNTIMSNNSAAFGGAIYNGGTVNFTSCSITGNTATGGGGPGGGIFTIGLLNPVAAVLISSGQVTGNTPNDIVVN
ncbi:MAG: hypothetical protein MUF83_18295 [Acidimicrobiales bacterium]|nr:hypothetical protein [Acidimicrobiales bacterium]